LVQYYFRLQLSHPEDLRYSYSGLVSYLAGIVADAAAAGEIRSVDYERTAALILHLVTTAIQVGLIGSPLMDPPPTP
jgi:hypothetical protein